MSLQRCAGVEATAASSSGGRRAWACLARWACLVVPGSHSLPLTCPLQLVKLSLQRRSFPLRGSSSSSTLLSLYLLLSILSSLAICNATQLLLPLKQQEKMNRSLEWGWFGLNLKCRLTSTFLQKVLVMVRKGSCFLVASKEETLLHCHLQADWKRLEETRRVKSALIRLRAPVAAVGAIEETLLRVGVTMCL